MPQRDDVHSPFSVYDVARGGGVRSQMVRGFLPLMRGFFALLAETSDSRMGGSFFADGFGLLEESLAAASTFLSRDRGGRVAQKFACVRNPAGFSFSRRLAK